MSVTIAEALRDAQHALDNWTDAGCKVALRELVSALSTPPAEDVREALADAWQLGFGVGFMDRQQQRSAELLIAIEPGQFRQDGRPYANAKAAHPGVIFSIDSRHGHLSYPCDTFTRWEDNLRAIALALEALRKVDRYGVTKRGEQYRGFLALEATAAPAGYATAEDALGFIRAMSGERPEQSDRAGVQRALRLAKRNTHPDTAGGAADAFQRVSLAEAKLREAGLL